MILYARGIQRIVEGVDYALERRLPTKGQVYAKLGDQVKPETIIAEGKVTAGFRVFRLGELLDVPPDKAKNYLHRTVGSRIYQGDVIAEASKMFGLRNVQFLAPVDGVLQDFNPHTGQLTLQFAPVTFRLPAGVKGKVSQIIPDEGVYVETQTSLLFGAFSGGKSREGALKIIAPPDQPIQPQAIDARLAGHIVAGGSLISKDVINRCLAVGVKGIVSGGISAHDLLEISGQPNSTEDVGLTLLITSGLGAMAIEDSTYQFLQRYQEQQVFLVPQEKMLVAPLPSDIKVNPQSSQPVEFLPLKIGDAVRILSSQYVGQVATVTKVSKAKPMSFSRLTIPTCLLQTVAGDTIEIPVTNLEVVANR
jgi:transcription antitermination factor NusG